MPENTPSLFVDFPILQKSLTFFYRELYFLKKLVKLRSIHNDNNNTNKCLGYSTVLNSFIIILLRRRRRRCLVLFTPDTDILF
jgi:hypothetical protein